MTSRNVLITGASGLVGSSLSRSLKEHGYHVFKLDRHDASSPFYFDSRSNKAILDDSIPLHAVINLAGANISDGRWTSKRKKTIWNSRIDLTAALCEALATRTHKPEVLLTASAIGYYGSQCSSPTDESGSPGEDFLAGLAIAWEAATQAAKDAGIRVVTMRFGLVLDADGGILQKLVLPLKAAVVGRMGDGKHLQPWIALSDLVQFIQQLMDDQDFHGPINLVAGEPASNGQFSATLAKTLHRFQLPPLPAGVLRVMFGEMTDAALLASSNIISSRQQELGIRLEYPELESALKAIYSRS